MTTQQFNEYASELETLKTFMDKFPNNCYYKSRADELQKWIDNNGVAAIDFTNFMDYLLDSETYSTVTNLYTPKKLLITAPCQVGKTNSILNVIESCITSNVSVILSCDNKNNQLVQIFNRLCEFISNKPNFLKTFVTAASNKSFENFYDKMKTHDTFVVCCLDNKSQITKIHDKLSNVNNPVKNFCIIHDEGDVVTKARNILEIEDSQPASHKQWISTVNDYYQKGMNVKRVFVSATAENVVYLHQPGYVLQLPVPINYSSSEDIEFEECTDYSCSNVVKILKQEVQQRKKDGGIILYCVERNTTTSDENHESVYNEILKANKFIGLDAISIYNGTGITVIFRTMSQTDKFERILESTYQDNYFTAYNDNSFVLSNKIPICDFYKHLQNSGAKTVLTIGKDLIARGISFVSSSKENPLTAVSLIYKPGNQLCQVSLYQAIGRLCGTARPELARKLYTSEDVYTNYSTFYKNREEILKCIKDNDNKVTSDLFGKMALLKSSRSIDRKALKLEKDITWSTESTCDEDDNDNTIDGVDLDKLAKWYTTKNTIVYQILDYLYKQKESVSIEQIMIGIKYKGGKNQLSNYIDAGRGLKSMYGKLWIFNKKVTINPSIKDYIKDNLV